MTFEQRLEEGERGKLFKLEKKAKNLACKSRVSKKENSDARYLTRKGNANHFGPCKQF